MSVTKEQFLQAYANLPLGGRKEIILVIDSQPITWNVANLEVSENTKLGKQILIKLEKLGIIKGD